MFLLEGEDESSVLLTELFRGERTIVCPPAADFTADGVVNLTDPIGILQQLYSEPGLETSEATIFCDG